MFFLRIVLPAQSSVASQCRTCAYPRPDSPKSGRGPPSSPSHTHWTAHPSLFFHRLANYGSYELGSPVSEDVLAVLRVSFTGDDLRTPRAVELELPDLRAVELTHFLTKRTLLLARVKAFALGDHVLALHATHVEHHLEPDRAVVLLQMLRLLRPRRLLRVEVVRDIEIVGTRRSQRGH